MPTLRAVREGTDRDPYLPLLFLADDAHGLSIRDLVWFDRDVP